MKRFLSLSSLLASLAVLGTAAAAQLAPVPHISDVPLRKSYAPGNVVINGSNLGIATSVKVNGVVFPIIRATPTRLIVGPVTPQDPGFGTVEVISGRSTDSATIELLPTLAAVRHGTRMNITLNNGDVGTYLLRFSYTALGTPATDLGIYGKRWLGLLSPPLTAGTGIFSDANPLVINGILVPVEIGQIGAPLRLQAKCTATTAGVTAYTNLASITAFGNPLP